MFSYAIIRENQSRNIARFLQNTGEYEVQYLAHNYVGQPILKSEIESEQFPFTILGCGREPYGKDILNNYLKTFQPDIFWCLLDTFMLFPWILNQDLSPSKFCMYYPSDGENFPLGCENVLKKAQFPVGMSKFAQAQVKNMFNVESGYIPHGLDSTLFAPFRQEYKIELRRKYNIPEDAFVIGDVARNQGRKALDQTIKAFKIFEADNKNAYLLLHTDPYDNAAYMDITKLIAHEGVAHKVIFSGMSLWGAFEQNKMPEIYNLLDARISTTTGEGFGIGTVEAMSCEIPQVITNYTTAKELITDNNSGITINPTTEITGTWNVERAMTSPKDFAEALQHLKDNPIEAKQMGRNGRQAVLKEYDWDRAVFPMWKRAMRAICEW